MPTPQRPPSSVPGWILRGGAVVMLAVVAFVYAQALGADRWPPGHPWSGISLSLGATMLLGFSFGPRAMAMPVRLILLVVAGLSLLSSISWFLSSMLAAR